jgi:hypothetical protein
MKSHLPFLALSTALTVVGGTASAAKEEPIECVELARSWDAAVEEAKALVAPIVVHSHGFNCPPCWGMHSAVMCNKKYMEFAAANTVEVISLQDLEDGIAKKDRRAATYEAKVNGEAVQCLVEFPGLTVEDMKALHGSKAASYNDTGGIPYTCLVDPFTLERMPDCVWKGGGTSASTIIESATAARKALQKEHGKGLSRKDLRTLADAEGVAVEKTTQGEYSAALDALGKLAGKASKWPDGTKARLEAARAKVVEAATKRVDELAAQKESDAATAKVELSKLASRLRGTGLEARVKDLIATP